MYARQTDRVHNDVTHRHKLSLGAVTERCTAFSTSKGVHGQYIINGTHIALKDRKACVVHLRSVYSDYGIGLLNKLIRY